MPVPSPYPDVEIPEVSLYDHLFDDFGDRGDAIAFVDGTSGASLTFNQLKEFTDKIAAALAERGIGAGDVVGMFIPNTPYYPAVFHGVLRANAIVTSANSLYTPGELAHQLADSGAKLLFTVSAFLDRAQAAADEVGLPKEAVIPLDGAEGYSSLLDLLGTTAEPPAQVVGPTDTAVLPYSSGTTGRAKGVILTHRNLVANLAQFGALTHVHSESVIMAVLPFFHIYGMTVMMNNGIFKRATVVTLPRFDLTDFLRTIAEKKVTYVYIAPPIAVALAKHPVVEEYDLSSIEIIFSGAAPLDAELGHAVAKRLNTRVRQGYGMTELSPLSHGIPAGRTDISAGTVGVLAPNMQARIVDPATGEDAGQGEPGELWLRGPNVMAGYLNNPEATAITIDADGWLHTGDVATVEDDVYSIVDRVKELIKYKGYQVAPAELEAVLVGHPAIADAAVIPAPDEEAGEVPKAFVVRAPGTDPTPEDIIAYVADRVAPYKRVRHVEFIDAIPKAASGKILRKDLRART